MSTEILVYILTPLAAVVVVLTRLRLAPGRRRRRAGSRSAGLLLVHTARRALVALVLWVLFLAFPPDTFLGGSVVGIVALGFFWVTAVAGLLILVRWLPTRGPARRRQGHRQLGRGPGLSVLAPRRDARRRRRVHLRLPHLRGVRRLLAPALGALLGGLLLVLHGPGRAGAARRAATAPAADRPGPWWSTG